MCYKVKNNGDVRSAYSNDDKTLYIVQDEAITSVCYPCTSTKTYHPDLSDMKRNERNLCVGSYKVYYM